MNDLIRRCAAFGWTLRALDGEYELLGNGPRATFGHLESLEDWLEHQERSTRRPADETEYEQATLELEAA